MEPDANPTQPTAGKPALSALHWVRDLVLSVFIALIVILFLYQPVPMHIQRVANVERALIHCAALRHYRQRVRAATRRTLRGRPCRRSRR